MKEPKNFLVFSGPKGIGKTYLCAALIDWALAKFPFFRKYNEAELLQRLRKTMDGIGDYMTELQYMLDDPLIFLDDVGSQGHTQWREEILFDTIDIRYNTMLPTIITTNLSREDFKKIYHPRIESRLFATENVIIELYNAPDLRQYGK